MKKTARLIALSAIATAALAVGPSAASAYPVASPSALTFSNVKKGTTSAPQNIFLASPCTTVVVLPPPPDPTAQPVCVSFFNDLLTVDIKVSGSPDFKTTRKNSECGGASVPPLGFVGTPGQMSP